MKIGILTFNEVRNYGGMLQAFALQEELKSYGHEVYHISTAIKTQNKIVNLKDLARKVLRLKSQKQYVAFSKRLSFYPGTYTEENAEVLNDRFDLFVSGSDQVWNITDGLNYMFYQKFVKFAKKGSYAASIGIDSIPLGLVDQVRNEINTFDYVSVREKTAQKILQSLTTKEIFRVVDPVFLLDRSRWDALCGKRIEKERYVFVYGTQMTQELKDIAYKIAEEKNLKICSVFPMKKAKTIDYYAGPLEFINYIKYADYVVTTSFHCTAFSIMYEKKLFEVLHSQTGSRAADLLELVGMGPSCMYDTSRKIENYSWDYSQAKNKLEKEVLKSKEYISKMVKGII